MIYLDNKITEIHKDIEFLLDLEYSNLYSSFENSKVIEIFSTIHYVMNKSYKQMNSRLPSTESSNRYFWADDSRRLIWCNDLIRQLQRSFKDSKYDFDLEDSYSKIITKTESFLVDSWGSELPIGLNKVVLIPSTNFNYYLKMKENMF